MSKKIGIKNKKQLLTVLEKIPFRDKEQRNGLVCSLIGHSRIQTICWGYYSCARCGQQLGDNLGSTYFMADKIVVVGHNCEICRKNAKALTWKDKIFAPNSFKK